MTIAKDSQTVIEVLRQNAAPQAKFTQVVIEVLRLNEDEGEAPETPAATARPVLMIIQG